MHVLVENLIVGILIVLSAAYLLRRGYQSLRGKKTGCGCSSCPAIKPPARKARPMTPPATPQGGP
jgi:hypothetical protein